MRDLLSQQVEDLWDASKLSRPASSWNESRVNIVETRKSPRLQRAFPCFLIPLPVQRIELKAAANSEFGRQRAPQKHPTHNILRETVQPSNSI